jgi:hypothetical protein
LGAAIGSALESPGDDPVGMVTDGLEVADRLVPVSRGASWLASGMLHGGGTESGGGGSVTVYRGLAEAEGDVLRSSDGMMLDFPEGIGDGHLYVTPHPVYAGTYPIDTPGEVWRTHVTAEEYHHAITQYGGSVGTPFEEVFPPFSRRDDFPGFFTGWERYR